MPRGINEALFERNADACETATHPKCICGCKGALHGMRHSLEWRVETFAQLKADAAELERLRAPDLFDEGRAPA